MMCSDDEVDAWQEEMMRTPDGTPEQPLQDTDAHAAAVTILDRLAAERDEWKVKAEQAEHAAQFDLAQAKSRHAADVATIQRVMRERDTARENETAIRRVLSGTLSPEKFVQDSGQFDLRLTGSGAQVITAALIELFNTGGASNFLTWKANYEGGDVYCVTIQKDGAETPEHKYHEVCAERDALRDAICPGWREKGLADKLAALARAFRSDSETMDEIGEDFDVSYRTAMSERDEATRELAACREVSRIGYADAVGPMKRALDAESENGLLKEALTEARRLLRRIDANEGWVPHTEWAALAAVLAQEKDDE